MNICMVLPNFFPPDIRVEKEARALIADGHIIHLVCMNKGGEPLKSDYEGIKIHRLKEFSKKFGKLSSLLNVNFFLNPFWRHKWFKQISKIVNNYDINILHVHDLPIVSTTISVGKKHNIPVIFDMHENWPEAIRAWGRKHLHQYFFSNIRLHKMLEKYCVNNATHVIVVVDEQKERLINIGIKSEKITVVMNTEDLDIFDNAVIYDEIVAKYNNKYIISYIGGFGPHRGLDTPIKAMPEILKKIPDAKLLLVGKGTNETDLIALCEKLGVAESVIFTGWVDFKYVPTYIHISNVCLVPHHSSGHTETTIPHKIFQYMLMCKPIIVTDVGPLARIARLANSGIIVPSGGYDEMGDAVIKLYNNQKLVEDFGKNGREAVINGLNWKTDADKLCKLYRRMEKK